MDPVDPKELELEEQELDAARFLPLFAPDFFAAAFGILLRGFFLFWVLGFLPLTTYQSLPFLPAKRVLETPSPRGSL